MLLGLLTLLFLFFQRATCPITGRTLSKVEEDPSLGPDFTIKRTFNGCTLGSCNHCVASPDNTYTYCSECGNGMNKTSSDGSIFKTECKTVLGVENCKIGSTLKKECIECIDNHYLLANKTCSPLYTTIKNCIYADLDPDGTTIKCVKCEEGYPSYDGSYCTKKLPLYDNCLYGSPLNIGDRFMKCGRCKDRYRILNGACGQEVIRGCLTHMWNNSLHCIQCNNQQGYYAINSDYFWGWQLQDCELVGLFLRIGSLIWMVTLLVFN